MRCYNCGAFLYEGNVCNVCGADVSLYKRIIQKSNELYNRGLEYAAVRNLSGAAQCLEISLKFYKLNINARNLLGLVYYGQGDYAKAFAQWVLSKNIQPENNLANDFIDNFQKSKAEMDRINHAISKYNKAVYYVQQGSYDLAEIQLKKLLNDHPGMVKGHQLLALLLIRKNKLAEARVALKKAEKIDAGNPVTIAYLASVKEDIKEEEKDLSPMEIKAKRSKEQPDEGHAPLSGDDVIIPKSSYREHNPMTIAIIQIIIGVIVGAALVFFIVTPAKTKSARAELTQVKTEYENQIASLNSQIEKLQSGSTSTENDNQKTTETAASDAYNILFDACKSYIEGNTVYAAQLLATIASPESVTDEHFTNLYNTLKDATYASTSENFWNYAESLYNEEDYEGAGSYYAQAYQFDNTDGNSLYYAGKSYDMAGNSEKAKEYYKAYLEAFPDGGHTSEASEALSNLG